MKKLPLPLYIVFLSLLVVSCGNSVKQENAKLVASGRIDLNLPGSDQVYGHLEYYTTAQAEYICYTTAQREIAGMNLKTRQIGFRIPVKFFDTMEAFNGSAYYIHTLDSIFILPFDSTAIYLINGTGTPLNKWVIQDTLENNVAHYSFVHLPQIPFTFINNTIHVMNARMDVVVNTSNDRKIYFASTPDVSIRISKNSKPLVSNTTGYWPAIYKSGSDYSDYHPQRCIGPENELVYGFSVSDSVWVYKNNVLVKNVECKSRYSKGFSELDPDSTFNLSYMERYWVTQPRYVSLTYDPFHDCYYRIFQQGINYEKEGGMTLNQTSDKPWSIMILDKELEIVNEIAFDPKLFVAYIFPSKEGLLVSNKLKQGRTDGISCSFTLFKIAK